MSRRRRAHPLPRAAIGPPFAKNTARSDVPGCPSSMTDPSRPPLPGDPHESRRCGRHRSLGSLERARRRRHPGCHQTPRPGSYRSKDHRRPAPAGTARRSCESLQRGRRDRAPNALARARPAEAGNREASSRGRAPMVRHVQRAEPAKPSLRSRYELSCSDLRRHRSSRAAIGLRGRRCSPRIAPDDRGEPSPERPALRRGERGGCRAAQRRRCATRARWLHRGCSRARYRLRSNSRSVQKPHSAARAALGVLSTARPATPRLAANSHAVTNIRTAPGVNTASADA